jgi:hypothetical protein
MLQGGSPRPPYIGQRMRSVPKLLVGYSQETKVYVTHLSMSRRSTLGEVHRGLVLSCTPNLEVVMN